MPSLMWFRSDLRTLDNTALTAACKASKDGVIALFVISPDQWRSHHYACVKVELILRTLDVLSASLAELNIPLRIIEASKITDVPKLVLKFAHEHACDALYFNKEYEIDEAKRDANTTSLFEQAGKHTYSFTDQVVLEPGSVRTGEGNYYTVFTPFKRAWIKHATQKQSITVTGKPKKQPPSKLPASKVPPNVRGFQSTVPSDLWPAGEHHARKVLSAFVNKRIDNYKQARDLPALTGTSTLSPYLTIGCISPRQCIAAAAEANTTAQPLDSGSEGIQTWISELIWREFYIHITVGFPRVCMHRAFQPATERIKWNDNDEHLLAWQEGRTGVPIIDAGMRQLVATGWMHNRIRMVVAMYFSKNLFLNWQLGEKFFMQNLIDGFLASNNGGWQWSASTGTDAAPYFRVFNPVSQSERFDPDGNYIRKYVPELASLTSKEIHAPWELPPMSRFKLDYPKPLVDLSKTRARAIEAFSLLRG